MYQKSAPETIQALFASIAKNYDKANTTFSFGLHKRWNKKLIESVGSAPLLLDLCAGTGEIAFGFLANNPHAQAILLDFCPEMLAVAKEKGAHLKERFSLLEGDAQQIALSDQLVDAVTISYGIRNVKEPLCCFNEVARVLKRKGTFSILELTRPTNPFFRLSHKLYLKFLLPLLGKLVARNLAAYHYLAESVEDFASPIEIEKKLLQAGFKDVRKKPLMGGLATLIIARFH